MELVGKTIGIIGFGRIGKAVARIALAFGMKVLVYDRYFQKSELDVAAVELDVLLQNSDVITLHCPQTQENRGLINAESIAKMKDGVLLLNDALYGILFRDINMQRTIVDQFFSRVINGYAGVIINTGEDNYLTTDDAITAAHTVLASQFLNEAFAKSAGMREEQMGLGHAFEMDPAVENTFLYELAQAQMAREIFPNAPLKYMPPTKFMTGNIFRGHIQDALFNMVTILTNQRLCLLGMMTEAIHTPFMSDRALSIENAQYIFRTMKDLGDELTYKEGGIIRTRANEVLTKATDLLAEIEKLGLFTTIEKGIFADVKRPKDGGKGLSGVVVKDDKYFNPFIEVMKGKVGA